jgi:hypothetical protein
MIALSIEDRHSLALSGTFEANLTASKALGKAASMFSTLIWRVFSGLSHLQETMIVGRDEVTRASKKSVQWIIHAYIEVGKAKIVSALT